MSLLIATSFKDQSYSKIYFCVYLCERNNMISSGESRYRITHASKSSPDTASTIYPR